MTAKRDGRAALLFDLDGTLTDNYLGIARSIRYALERLGVEPPDEAVLRRCVGPPLRTTFAALLASDDPASVEQAVALYRERFADLGWRENVVYAGIPEALAALAAQGRRMVLCTSKPEIYARRIVTLFGFTEFLSGVYGADLHGRFDDKALLLAHLVEREGLDATRAVMVGDRHHDVRAARLNGARAVGVLWGYGSEEELAGADARVREPAELVEALGR
ncbi:MAG TPA: HAD hydrolase-like protein [Casimicrobiaceae bacterium]|jgi:phosphoglycolate phosphatase|nr:HAD hydrolase-like protein [Casimicrobiaceae bacterium]